MGGVGIGLSALGMLSSANAAKDSALSTQQNLKFQADMDAINARLSESNSETALIQGQRQAQSSMLHTAQIKSTQRASMAANGIDLGSDTATNILTTTDVMGEIDKNTIESNAVKAAWGFKTQASNFTSDALIKNATSSTISPGASYNTALLTGAGGVANNWYSMNKKVV